MIWIHPACRLLLWSRPTFFIVSFIHFGPISREKILGFRSLPQERILRIAFQIGQQRREKVLAQLLGIPAARLMAKQWAGVCLPRRFRSTDYKSVTCFFVSQNGRKDEMVLSPFNLAFQPEPEYDKMCLNEQLRESDLSCRRA